MKVGGRRMLRRGNVGGGTTRNTVAELDGSSPNDELDG